MSEAIGISVKKKNALYVIATPWSTPTLPNQRHMQDQYRQGSNAELLLMDKLMYVRTGLDLKGRHAADRFNYDVIYVLFCETIFALICRTLSFM